jgi:hypothetical protein
MNIYLIKSEEYKTEEFNLVVSQLNTLSKELNFIGHIQQSISYDTDNNIKEWTELFNLCVQFREVNLISQNDIVILLTELENEKKWFGWTDDTLRNYFVQTSQWDKFFPNELNNYFPILYEIVSWVFRSILFDSKEEMLEAAHKDSRGCMMDFCKEKSEVILKMRTADICYDCLDIIRKRNIKQTTITDFFSIYEGIRKHLIFRERYNLSNDISSIKINLRAHKVKDMKIKLVDIQNIIVNLKPLETSIYILFLKHPKGIFLKDLSNYKDELQAIYSIFKFGNLSSKNFENTFKNLTIFDDINSRITNIKKEFTMILGSNLADNYIIQKSKNGKNLIKLDRLLVEIIE